MSEQIVPIEETQTPINIMNVGAEGNLELAVLNAEKFIVLQDRIRKTALRLTSVYDWVDEGGKPYLQWTGTSKIAMAFGVSYKLESIVPETATDEHGDYVEYTVTGFIKWNGRELPEVGTGSSRDSFFGIRNKMVDGERTKVYLPLSEIDKTDIKKKAITNFLNRGMKSLLGLSFTWDEIGNETGGAITRNKIKSNGGGVSYSGGSRGGNTDTPELKEKRNEIRKMILELCDGEENCAKEKLQSLTKYKDSAGKTSVDALSEKQVGFIHSKVKKEMAEMLEKLSADK